MTLDPKIRDISPISEEKANKPFPKESQKKAEWQVTLKLGLQSHFCRFPVILKAITQKGTRDILVYVTTGRTLSLSCVITALLNLAQ